MVNNWVYIKNMKFSIIPPNSMHVAPPLSSKNQFLMNSTPLVHDIMNEQPLNRVSKSKITYDTFTLFMWQIASTCILEQSWVERLSEWEGKSFAGMNACFITCISNNFANIASVECATQLASGYLADIWGQGKAELCCTRGHRVHWLGTILNLLNLDNDYHNTAKLIKSYSYLLLGLNNKLSHKIRPGQRVK